MEGGRHESVGAKWLARRPPQRSHAAPIARPAMCYQWRTHGVPTPASPASRAPGTSATAAATCATSSAPNPAATTAWTPPGWGPMEPVPHLEAACLCERSVFKIRTFSSQGERESGWLFCPKFRRFFAFVSVVNVYVYSVLWVCQISYSALILVLVWRLKI